MRTVLVVFLFSIILTLPWLGSSEFYTRGEPREAIVAQRMITENNWVLPRAYSGVIPSKPPFFHWTIAGISKIVGAVNEFTARAPSTLFSIIFAASFSLFLLKLGKFKEALYAPLFLCTSFEWARASVSCRVDMVHSSALATGLILAYLWLNYSTKRVFSYITTIVFLTIAFLTKGPVAVIIAGAITFVFQLILKKRFLEIIVNCTLICLPPLLISIPWYLAAYQIGGEEFYSKVWDENFGRFSGSMIEGAHKHSVAYLAVVFFVGLLPWSLCSTGYLLWIKRNLQSFSKWHNWDKYCALVICTVFLFYALPSSKRGVYLLVSYPFFAYFFAKLFSETSGYMPRIENSIFKVSKIIFGALLSVAIFFTIVRVLASFIESSNQFTQVIENFKYVPFYTFILGFVVVFSINYFKQIRIVESLIFRSMLLWISSIILVNSVIQPSISKLNSEKSVISYLQRVVSNQQPLYSFGHEFYGVSFYLGRDINRLETNSLQENSVILLEKENVRDLEKKLQRNITVLQEIASPLEKEKHNILVVR